MRKSAQPGTARRSGDYEGMATERTTKTLSIAAVLAAFLLTACDNAGDPEVEPPVPPAEETGSAAPAGDSGDRASEALGEAGDAARRTLENLGEAGSAGVEALRENAPEIRENIGEAGQRLRNAADALLTDPDQPASDSAADANVTPEAAEPSQ